MAGAPGTNITRPRAKSAIQKTIMADETTSSVSKVSCLENDRKFALVSLPYSWYLTFGHQGCFLIKKSTAKSPRKRSAGLNCSRFEARGFKHTAHASFPCFQTTLKRLFIPRALLLSPSSSKHTHVHPSWQKCLKNSWEDGMGMLEICTARERCNIWTVQNADCRLQTDCRPLFSVLENNGIIVVTFSFCVVKTMVCSSLQSAFCTDQRNIHQVDDHKLKTKTKSHCGF